MAAGLSPEDSEAVADRFLDGLLSCLLDAARSEGEGQAFPFDDVLLAFEQAIDDPDIDEPTIVDTRRVEQKAESCALVQMQKAGISFELIMQQQGAADRSRGK